MQYQLGQSNGAGRIRNTSEEDSNLQYQNSMGLLSKPFRKISSFCGSDEAYRPQAQNNSFFLPQQASSVQNVFYPNQ
jgi:hypothetical protein